MDNQFFFWCPEMFEIMEARGFHLKTVVYIVYVLLLKFSLDWRGAVFVTIVIIAMDNHLSDSSTQDQHLDHCPCERIVIFITGILTITSRR